MTEQIGVVKVDNTSVIVPGGNAANCQFGFCRTETPAQNQNITFMETGTTILHLSVMRDTGKSLNTSHEYQFPFLGVPTGGGLFPRRRRGQTKYFSQNHVFSTSTGTPFTIPTASPDSAYSDNICILDFSNKAIYSSPFPADGSWTNLAIQVYWKALTLAVFASQGALPLIEAEGPRGHLAANTTLKAVTGLVHSEGVPSSPAGQGGFHFGVLKYSIADPNDSASASNTSHSGSQEGSTDGLFFSGVFV
ncbi:hypothetical protein B0J17DRAFT_713916 [Rhizoctonia solani]|nr:hypothetical protein B0J17DRAFT_713916 [Rhizoctonia solani]